VRNNITVNTPTRINQMMVRETRRGVVIAVKEILPFCFCLTNCWLKCGKEDNLILVDQDKKRKSYSPCEKKSKCCFFTILYPPTVFPEEETSSCSTSLALEIHYRLF
jgi:hypothetical protein